MVAFANICLGLASLEFLALLMLLNSGRERVTGNNSPVFWWVMIAILFTYAALFCVVVASGRLGASLWLRALLVPGALISCLCLISFAGFTIWCQEIRQDGVPAAIRYFGFHASWIIPALMLLFSFLLLNHHLVPRVPLPLLRTLLFALGFVGIGACLSVFSEWAAFDKRHADEVAERHKADSIEYERTAHVKVEKAQPEQDFTQLLEFTTDPQSSAEVHQLATRKLLASGPKLAPLLAAQLKTGDFQRSLQFLRDNELPDPAPLAEPARAAMLRFCARVRDPDAIIWATEFDLMTGVILKVADKYKPYGVDYVPAVREYRAALVAPETKKTFLPSSCLETVDAWLATHR